MMLKNSFFVRIGLMQRILVLAAALVFLTSWAGGPASAAPAQKPLTLLVSIDGFRADYLQRGKTPTLASLARRGTHSSGLISSFPSVTFPNHYSIVTGLVPDHHGIVNNTMHDPAIPDPVFALSSRSAVSNPLWWNEATPVWVTAARHGKVTSAMFWPGTETPIHGVQPRNWLPYSDLLSSGDRVDQLLKWLSVSPSERSDFATLYFSEVDTAGHLAGPDSPELDAALGRVDTALAHLFEGLRKLGLRGLTNVVIVSDHGMAPVPAENVVNLSPLLEGIPAAKIRWFGTFAGIEANAEDATRVLAALHDAPHMQCWRKGEMPAVYRFGTHRRIPDIVCLAETGWWLTDDLKHKSVRGQHGYDPRDPLMHGLFIAQGSRLVSTTLPDIANVEVYPLLCRLLGIPPEANDATGQLRSLVWGK